ncbi:MAG: ERAP1-like C-terminal domain-containing protein [Planctomycetes bacterium]|nr:ERAP1-like C-terminal domain-containing protein [Planctomycetota bacterium]
MTVNMTVTMTVTMTVAMTVALRLALAHVTTMSIAAQDPEPGISRDLAEDRARRVGDVHYRLDIEIAEGAPQISGRLQMSFDLEADDASRTDLAIDFAGDSLSEVLVNGMARVVPLRQVADHLVLPAELLGRGRNTFEATFRSTVAASGTPVTRYRDESDGSEYVYTLLVPADAHRLFPCFDQPDLRARFTLTLTVPGGWSAVGNAAETNGPDVEFPEVPRESPDGRRCFTFATTAPLPTYLFAFAAGPFEVVEDHEPSGVGDAPERPLRIFCRPARRASLERATLFGMHRRALAWLGAWFDIPYPFGKLDLVLVPGFPYGGMEHAGAIFYRESSMAFERPPTVREQVARSTLVYHEISHQWFGNLVTMRWFDDLWLKEGFATLLGFRLLEELEPERQAWLRFLQRVKPSAYAVDSVPDATTPIYQELANLTDAKSNYGPIVYDKAPAVLRELENELGRGPFRSGLRLFVRRHAFGNATWQDLLSALTDAAGLKGSRWADRWILGAGMPQLVARWTVDPISGDVTAFTIEQSNAPDDRSAWPLSMDVLLLDSPAGGRRLTCRVDGKSTPIPAIVGRPAPRAVLLNPSDVAYGQMLLDADSRGWLLWHAAEIADPLTRAVALSALLQSVRDAELDPRRFAAIALEVLRRESDAESHGWLLGMLRPVVTTWLAPDAALDVAHAIEQVLFEQLDAGRSDVAIESFRFLAAYVSTPRTQSFVRDVLAGATALPGDVRLAPRDRFLGAAALLAAGDAEAVDREVRRSAPSDDIGREVYVARAAGADPAVKASYFDSFLRTDGPPESWVSESLQTFHWPGQQELTLPYLGRALEQVEWVKEHRRIFFMPAWIDAFVSAHSSAEAVDVVERYLDAHPSLALDVRRKILQSLDTLRRAVRIRERFD